MSVGWILASAVVLESRNGCIAWIALLLRTLSDKDEDAAGKGGDLFAVGIDVEEAVWVLVRSCTFMDAAEPGMRLASTGAALRRSVRLEVGLGSIFVDADAPALEAVMIAATRWGVEREGRRKSRQH